MSGRFPFISVVVPTYRRPAQLAECLEALARQSYPRERFEVVVVDDGSGGPPAPVVESLRARLDVTLAEQPHAGPSAARNTGARRARGQYLAFTDDDCAPDENWLSELAARLTERRGSLVGGRTVNALERNAHAATSQAIIEVVYEHYNPRHDDARFFASNNMAVPAEDFRALGGFDESFTTSEDRDLCDRWRASGRVMAYAPGAIVRHAHHLTLLSLWRQHYGYGRGAFRFYRARRARGAEGFKPDPGFYLKMLSRPFTRTRAPRSFHLAALVVWSQTANTLGFVHEYVKTVTGDN
ncbi:MAG TPA: glycosyltransferase [Pyrinomonadaceae bacterium]|nr:glycosyltransferase [Pyrinomonadaceae bacterium]